MRSLELQKPMLRCTNSGVTTIIDPQGNLEKTIAVDKEGVLSTTFKTYKGMTPYAKYGDTPVVFLMFALLILGFISSKKKIDKNNDALQKLVRP